MGLFVLLPGAHAESRREDALPWMVTGDCTHAALQVDQLSRQTIVVTRVASSSSVSVGYMQTIPDTALLAYLNCFVFFMIVLGSGRAIR